MVGAETIKVYKFNFRFVLQSVEAWEIVSYFWMFQGKTIVNIPIQQWFILQVQTPDDQAACSLGGQVAHNRKWKWNQVLNPI